MTEESEIEALKQRIRELEEKVENSNTDCKENNESKSISRRQFLKKAGLGTAGLAALMTPASALNINTDELSVNTGSDSGSLTENLAVDTNGDVEIPNGNLNMDSNSLENVNEINGEDVDDLGGGASDELVFANFPTQFSETERQNFYDNFQQFAESGNVEQIFLNPVTQDEVVNDNDVMNDVANQEAAMNAIVNLRTAMDAVSGSSTAMDAVSDSETAMDAVSDSETAMDAVSDSETAMDAVIDSDDVALPKVVDSQTAMDAVSDSETAMDAVIDSDDVALPKVVDSETAMDAVSGSQTAMDAVSDSSVAMDAVSISSHLDTKVFTDNYASEQVWGYYVENSEFTDYYSFSGFSESFHDAELSLVNNGYGGRSLKHEVNSEYSNPSGSPLLIGVVKTVDLSGKSELWVDYDANGRSDYSDVYVEVDGDTKLNTHSGSGPDTFSVSEYDGEVEFIFAVRYRRSNNGDEIELKAFRFE